MAKKLKERVKKIAIKPFPQELHVVVTNDIRASYDKRRKRLGDLEVPLVAQAFVVRSDGSTVVTMFLPEETELSSVVHESVHVVHHVMEQTGTTFEEEIWAYHLGYLFEQVSAFLHQKKRK